MHTQRILENREKVNKFWEIYVWVALNKRRFGEIFRSL